MSWILLLALAQSQPERTVEGLIDALLTGDVAARSELVKRGVYSIRPLQKLRHRGQRKIDALLFEIKSAAAYPTPVTLPGRFEDRGGTIGNRQWQEPLALVQLFHQKDIPIFTDQFDPDLLKLKSTRMIVFNSSTRLQVIETFCEYTGLDYGFFHNSVVIGTSERLWPNHEPPKITKLDGPALAQARALIGKLEDPSIEVREAATRDLLALGTGVIPLLEAQRKRAEGELVTRCEAILRILGRESCAFGPASCLRQKLGGADQALLEKLGKTTPRLSFESAPFSELFGALEAQHGVTVEISPEHANKASIVITSGQSLLDLLSLITQSHDLDFVIANGKIVIDARAVIRKRLAVEK